MNATRGKCRRDERRGGRSRRRHEAAGTWGGRGRRTQRFPEAAVHKRRKFWGVTLRMLRVHSLTPNMRMPTVTLTIESKEKRGTVRSYAPRFQNRFPNGRRVYGLSPWVMTSSSECVLTNDNTSGKRPEEQPRGHSMATKPPREMHSSATHTKFAQSFRNKGQCFSKRCLKASPRRCKLTRAQGQPPVHGSDAHTRVFRPRCCLIAVTVEDKVKSTFSVIRTTRHPRLSEQGFPKTLSAEQHSSTRTRV